MFWRRTNWTHRVRLTALLTVAVSIALALVFALIWLLLRSQALDRRFFYLERTVKRAAHEWSGPASLEEEHEDFPGIDMAVYGGDGRTVAVVGKHPPDYLLGRRRKDDRLTYGRSRDGLTFVGATSWAETEGGLGQLALVLAGLWLPLTFLTAGLSWYGGGLVLRPIRELVASAEELSGSSNDQSLTTTDTAEFASLAASLNQLIARVRHAASLQEQFATDAAHELRNPLALLRTRVEATLLRERAPAEYEAALKSQLIEIERLTSIVETLLLSARQPSQEAGKLRLDSETAEATRQWALAHGWPADRLELSTEPCEVRISADEVAIILRNLLENGARHAPPGTPLVVQVTSQSGHAELTVRDFGIGLSEQEATLAFDRFYRSDQGRNRQQGGAGIGLAVVKRIVVSRAGTVAFVPMEKGAMVRVTLPLV